MALASIRDTVSSARFLPPGATLFFRQRAMELLGIAVIILGMAGLIALITYHATDPSLNRATGFAPNIPPNAALVFDVELTAVR